MGFPQLHHRSAKALKLDRFYFGHRDQNTTRAPNRTREKVLAWANPTKSLPTASSALTRHKGGRDHHISHHPTPPSTPGTRAPSTAQGQGKQACTAEQPREIGPSLRVTAPAL